MRVTKKIQAGALQLVLFVGAIIAVVLLCFVLLAYSNQLFHKKTDLTVALIQAAHSGLQTSLQDAFDPTATSHTPGENALGIENKVAVRYWGLFQLRKAWAKKGAVQFERWAVVGHTRPELPALYLKDNQFPLVVAGNSRITGTAYLPERGVKMGNIYGHSYQGSQLIFGKTRKSDARLPDLDNALTAQLQQLTGPLFDPQGEVITFKSGMAIKNSFGAPTKIIKGATLILDKASLKGNVMVWASKQIVVPSTAQLNDIVLLAPNITIESGVYGNFQAVAQKKIAVGKGSRLTYPSLLAVQGTPQSSNTAPTWIPPITLDTDAEVRGILIYQDQGRDKRYVPHIRIATNARVYGEVFCTQNLELKGAVYGNVTTRGFLAMENGNSYQNHLYNGTIDSTVLPQEYGGLCYNGHHMNQVIQWLY
ncbi:MAG: hypothetical protein AAF634_00395 [Bacteroidota bacterium]